MNTAKEKETKKKIYYIKYKKSSIFDNSPNITERNNNTKITEKITKKKYDKIFKPKEDSLTSRQRYIKSLYDIDLNELIKTPKKSHSKINRKPLRPLSSYTCKNNKKKYLHLFLSEKFNNNKKRKMSFFRQSSNNDENSIKILRTTTNHKLRSLHSKFSDIFNTNNKINYSEANKNKLSKNNNTIEKLNKTSMNIKRKIQPIINSENFSFREINPKNHIIKSEREKEQLLRRNVKEKAYNKKSDAKSENIKNELFPPIYKFKEKIKNKKTDINNLESVNYNIINNRKNNKREDYINLSSIVPSSEIVDKYEIIIPKNYNTINEMKLKNILHAEGIHFFNFSEHGDIIGGTKGRYSFKIRNSINDNKFKDKIKKVNCKFSKINVKLKKLSGNYSRKNTGLI